MVIQQDRRDVERKVVSILKVLSDAGEPVGARLIARNLRQYGIDLAERSVRYHLKLMDGQGLTQAVGRDGRLITELGLEELRSALVTDKVGFVIARIELLAYCTTFDPDKRQGQIVINTTLFDKGKFKKALAAMRDAFKAGLCVSDLVAVAEEGEKVGEMVVPRGKAALATVCSITINGVLLKAGIPMDSRFGGILQLRNRKPVRFVELISYSGSSLDPSEAFIRARMTSAGEAARRGNGHILANFREIPSLCQPLAEGMVEKLKQAGIGGVLVMGQPGEAVCQFPVGPNRTGVILLGGLNPVAAAAEAGVEGHNRAMSGFIDFNQLRSFFEL